MTEQQFHVLSDLMGISDPDRDAAMGIIFNSEEGSVTAEEIAARLRQADMAIRGAYVLHGPMEFRITVGHRDFHRGPGAIQLKVGDIVRLVAQSTERWVPVRVTALPATPLDYYGGVITEQLAKGSRYQVGNGVRFSEDQIMTDIPRAASRRRAQ
ncbi:MAG: alpha/beta hydrolase [Burkholderiaceae bacterium]|nr:alpha/beta hydrolase [Burkholderiaceae bacterium]